MQCSACGNTWFQAHPSQATRQAASTAPDPDPEDLRAALQGTGRKPPPPRPEPAAKRGIDPDVADILRQEAEHEAQLRASEAAGLESQPDLGLDDVRDEAELRARQARERMARLRGAEAAEPGDARAQARTAEPDPAAASRRDLLPDIDQINSTLRSRDETSRGRTETADAAEPATQARSGFTRGFLLAVIFALALLLVYINAARLSQAVPQLAPVLDAYVGVVDQARLWLDARLSSYLTK